MVLTGHQDGETLVRLYSAADLFVFPSLYEGWTSPPLEAMACGVPVVASRASSLPETVGDAAELVDPLDPADIARGMARVVEDPARRAELRRRGLARAAKFTWERSISATVDLYRRLAMATASPAEKRRAAGQAASRADYGEDYFGRPRFRKFLPFLRPGGRVLDLGSHSGVLLNFLEANGFTAVGVDRNPASVARCRALGFNVLEGDVFAILESPAHAEAFDAVFLSDFVEHLIAARWRGSSARRRCLHAGACWPS